MFAQSFPPANALIDTLKSVDYQKHLNNLKKLIIIIAAVSYVIYCNLKEWWQNGGQDATVQNLQKVWNFLQVSYTWVRDQAIPELKIFIQEVKDFSSDKIVNITYQIEDLMTV
jgi:hypothetical protein